MVLDSGDFRNDYKTVFSKFSIGSGMQKEFSTSLEQLPSMLEFIQEEATAVGFKPEQIGKIELASEEALVNVIQYAYSDGVGPIEIECERLSPNGLKIIIRDNGIAFNPLNSKAPDKNMPVEERNLGGYGVYFIRQLMDEVFYQRENDKNVFVMVKILKNKP
jgi:anti-sigma regulatory factor (Ser/Thr protein kinase)